MHGRGGDLPAAAGGVHHLADDAARRRVPLVVRRVVWVRFLPPDDDEPVLECESNKELFSRLCDAPVLLDGATTSFGVERRSGAKCFMLSARALSIAWGDDPTCWMWTATLPGSRFPEVAELVDVCWLEISGKLRLSLLSPGTTYAAYLVFAIADDSYGLECHVGMLPPKATVTVVSGSSGGKPAAATTTTTEHAICLQHMQGEEEEVAVHRRKQQYVRLVRKGYGRKMVTTREADPDIKCPRRRGDGWAEVELGEFAVAGDGGGVVEVRLEEVDSRRWKRGLIVQGVEIRPKHACKRFGSRFASERGEVGCGPKSPGGVEPIYGPQCGGLRNDCV